MERWLRRVGIALGAMVALAGLAAVAVYVGSERIIDRRHPLPEDTVSVPEDAASIDAGRRLAALYGCTNGCHGRNGEGVLFIDDPAVARLVAPSLAAAVRRYSVPELVTILRHGLRPDGTSVLVMPAQCFTWLTDEDVGRIIAYLRTLPAGAGPAAVRSVGPIGRLGLVSGKFRTAAQLLAEGVAPPEARTDPARHGRYLARTICAECHGLDLHGDSNPEFSSPDLRVVAAYSPEQFAHLMRTGQPIGDRRLGVMRVRARQNLSHLTDEEIAALYVYLRSLAGG